MKTAKIVSLIDPGVDEKVVVELIQVLEHCAKPIPDWFLTLTALRAANEQERIAGRKAKVEVKEPRLAEKEEEEDTDSKLVNLTLSLPFS